MKKMNVIVIFDKNLEKTLMCKRTKEPYMGMYNLVGGKIEKENDGLNEAYRELVEETNIKREDVELIHFMNLTYVKWDKEQNYIFDRYAYSTIIRINYELGKPVEETINEIINYKYKPDLIIVLKSNKEKIKKRLVSRYNFDFNEDFYNYENQIYEYLSTICDIMFIVNNNGNIDDTIEIISSIINQNIRVRKKVNHERRI